MNSKKQLAINECLGYYDGVGFPKVNLASTSPDIDPDIVAWHEQVHKSLEEGSMIGLLSRLCAIILKNGRDDLPKEITKQLDELITSLQNGQTAFVHEGLATYLGLIWGARGDVGIAKHALSVMPPFYQNASEACALAFGSIDQIFGSEKLYNQIPQIAFDVGVAALNLDLLNQKFDINDLSGIRDHISANTPDSRFARFISHFDPPDRPGPLKSFLDAPETDDMFRKDDQPVSYLDPYRQVTQELFSILNLTCPDVPFVSDRAVSGRWSMEVLKQAKVQLTLMGSNCGNRIDIQEEDDCEHEVTFVADGVPEWMPLDRSLWQTKYPSKSKEHFIEYCRQCENNGFIMNIFLWPEVKGNSMKLEDSVGVVASVRSQKGNPSQADPPSTIDIDPFSVVLDNNSIDDILSRHPELRLTLRTDERFIKEPDTYFGRWPVPCFILMRHTSVNHISQTLSSLSSVTDVCILNILLDSQLVIVLKPKGSTVYYAAPTTYHISGLILKRTINNPREMPFDKEEYIDEFAIDRTLMVTVLRGCYVGLDSLDVPWFQPGKMTVDQLRELSNDATREFRKPS